MSSRLEIEELEEVLSVGNQIIQIDREDLIPFYQQDHMPIIYMEEEHPTMVPQLTMITNLIISCIKNDIPDIPNLDSLKMLLIHISYPKKRPLSIGDCNVINSLTSMFKKDIPIVWGLNETESDILRLIVVGKQEQASLSKL